MLPENYYESTYKPLYTSLKLEAEVQEREQIKFKLGNKWKDIYWKFDIEILRCRCSEIIVREKNQKNYAQRKKEKNRI